MADDRMPFTRHLEEFRKRLIRAFIAIAVGFAVCYGFAEKIFGLLARPLVQVLPQGGHLTLINVTEGFVTYLKTGFYAGLLLASPAVLYQIWAFISPGLFTKERRVFGTVIFFSSLLFAAGVSFGYFVFLPACMKFFVTYIKGFITANFSIAWYLSFSAFTLLAFGLVFQIPLILLLLNRIGLVDARFLRKFRKYAFLLSFVVGAVLTPTPDVLNQSLMSVPIYILYEASIWLIVFFGRKKKEAAETETAAPEAAAGASSAGPGPTLAG